jgi:hypothetical protein
MIYHFYAKLLSLKLEMDFNSIDISSKTSNYGYCNVSALHNSDSNDWPINEMERQKLKCFGFILTGEDSDEKIGEGAFGQVWRCEKRLSKGEVEEFVFKVVALKFYMIEKKTLKRAQQLIINEMKAHQLANHPNIVRTEFVHHIYDR